MNKQTEREFREALDTLRFSNDGKERIMNNLTERQTQDGKRPGKGRRLLPLRTGLAAALVCAALVGTVSAATIAVRQSQIHFHDSYQDAVDARKNRPVDEKGSIGFVGGVYGIETDSLKAFDEMDSMDMDTWWNGEQGLTLLEESAGTAGDGWTAKRVFEGKWIDQPCLSTRYKAERLSDLRGLWDVWDTTWLEENYTTLPEQMLVERMEIDGQPFRDTVIGVFQGQDGQMFNVQYGWDSDVIWGDEDFLSEGLDHHEVYTTADGAEATIMTATSQSGKGVFWVSVISGHSRFSMFGSQVELDELHTILDSLHLSKLLEAA